MFLKKFSVVLGSDGKFQYARAAAPKAITPDTRVAAPARVTEVPYLVVDQVVTSSSSVAVLRE